MGKTKHLTPASLLKWMVNIALFCHILVTAVVLVMVLVIIYSPEEDLLSAWPITIGRNLAEYQLSPNHQNVENPAIEIDEGILSFTSTRGSYYFWKFIDAAVILLMILLIIILTRRVVSTLADNNPFCEENARRLRKMAFLIMALTPYHLLQGHVYRVFIRDNILVEGAEFASFAMNSNAPGTNEIRLHLGFDCQPLLIGLLLLVIAEVFRIGVSLRRDSESII